MDAYSIVWTFGVRESISQMCCYRDMCNCIEMKERRHKETPNEKSDCLIDYAVIVSATCFGICCLGTGDIE